METTPVPMDPSPSSLSILIDTLPFIFSAIFLEFLVALSQRKFVHRLNDILFSISVGALHLLMWSVFSVGPFQAVFGRVPSLSMDESNGWHWLGMLVVLDLCYYIYHRTSHHINLLWAVHAVHHSSQDYNLSTGLRQGLLEPVVSCVFYLPLTLLGCSPRVFATLKQIHYLYQFWVHTAVEYRLAALLRPLSSVLVTPSFHRVHHQINLPHLFSNYGGMFVAWDRLFGTCQNACEQTGLELDHQDAWWEHGSQFGLPLPLRTFDPLWHNLYWFSRVFGFASSSSGPTPSFLSTCAGSIRLLWASPACLQASEEESAVASGSRPQVYHPWLPRGLTFYILVHFLLTCQTTLYLLNLDEELPWAIVLSLYLFVPLGFASFAAFLDRVSYAFQIETVRLVVCLALRLKFLRWSFADFTGRELESWAIYVFTIGSLIWIRFYDYKYSALFLQLESPAASSHECKEPELLDDVAKKLQ